MRNSNHSAGIKVSGITSIITNERWVRVDRKDDTAWAPLCEFGGRNAPALNRLQAQGVILIGVARQRELLDLVDGLNDFPPAIVIEGPGWQGPYFALQDGTTFGPEGRSPDAVVFVPVSGKCERHGKHSQWMKNVALPLEGNALAMFALALSFAAPLLALSDRDGNFGFEIVGPKGIGKSTLQRLAASALGGIGGSGRGRYDETFDTTLNALEPLLKAHSDLPLFLDEAALLLAGSSAQQRSKTYRDLVFKIATGDEKARFGVHTRRRGLRTVFLSSSNEPLASIIGKSCPTADAASDRQMTIGVQSDWAYGVFEKIPRARVSGSDFAANLLAAAGENHGTAIRRFLKSLVREREADNEALRKKIRRWVAAFQKKAEINPNQGSEVRVSQAFGLVYAAGKLACEYGALPKDWKGLGPAVLRCHRLHLQARPDRRPLIERLHSIANLPDTVVLQRPLTPVPVGAWAFLKGERDSRELLLLPKQFRKRCPDSPQMLQEAERTGLLTRERRNATVKRSIFPGKEKERVHCFRLPAKILD